MGVKAQCITVVSAVDEASARCQRRGDVEPVGVGNASTASGPSSIVARRRGYATSTAIA